MYFGAKLQKISVGNFKSRKSSKHLTLEENYLFLS